MNICKIWDSEYPWDVRVEKISAALTGAGHQVHMVARNRDGRPLRERLPEAEVHRLKPLPWLGRRLSDATMFPAFTNPRWIRAIERTARRTDADLLLVRDLPLAPTAVYVGRRLGLPVVLDMAEHYAAMMQDLWDAGNARWSDYLVRNPRLVEKVERWTVRHVDHILVVVEESRDRLRALGVSSERITVVCNTPPIGRLDSIPASRTDSPPGKLHAVYLGLMERPRGVEEALRAVAEVRATGCTVTLDLIGEGMDLPAFRGLARRLALDENGVRFHGFLPYGEALRLVAKADVGLIPHHATDGWCATIPNKLFDYMAAGVPVVASDVPPVARVLREAGAGLVFRDRDAGHFAQILEQMARDGDRARYGVAGRESIRIKYHWERDASRMLAVMERVRRNRAGDKSGGGVIDGRKVGPRSG